MKIQSVNIPDEEENGFSNINMRRLGEVVLIAGKNGAGKTRFLNLLKNKLMQYPNKKQETNWIDEITRRGIENTPGEQAALKVKEQLILNREKTTAFNFFEFLPNNFSVKSHTHSSLADLEKAYGYLRQLDNQGPINWEISDSPAFCYLAYIQNRYFEASHQNSQLVPEVKEKIFREYESLQDLLLKFIGTKLERSNDGSGDFTLFERKHGEINELSNGQKILLQFCIEIHSKGNNVDELILFLDEPENHLHPAILLEVMDKIIEVVKNGQIWIATHSVNLISHLPNASQYYIDSGKVEYIGNNPQKVIEGLLGNVDERNRLSDFIDLPFRYAEMKFCYECLISAQVVENDGQDPQINQVGRILKEVIAEKKALKVLDYGAGKGRLIKYLNMNEPEDVLTTENILDYVAYDECKKYANDCKRNIEIVYETSQNRYFNSFSELESHFNTAKFDIVIMLNVFHELEPDLWLNMFKKDGELDRVLQPNGILLIIEHQVLNYGEMAHSKGFLMFDKEEFKCLFECSDNDEGSKYHVKVEESNQELKAHYIHKDLLRRVSADSIKRSIDKLKESAIEEIRKVKKQEATLKNGRKLAFWSQQLANASIASE